MDISERLQRALLHESLSRKDGYFVKRLFNSTRPKIDNLTEVFVNKNDKDDSRNNSRKTRSQKSHKQDVFCHNNMNKIKLLTSKEDVVM